MNSVTAQLMSFWDSLRQKWCATATQKYERRIFQQIVDCSDRVTANCLQLEQTSESVLRSVEQLMSKEEPK